MKRFLVLAALAAAAFVGGAEKASANFLIQINGLNLVNGDTVGADPLDFLKVGGTVITSPTATAVNFDLPNSTLQLNGANFPFVASFLFPDLTIAANGTGGATISGTTTTFTINPALIPAGQALVSATLSVTDPENSVVYTGNFGGSIFIRTQAIPEPASMAMLAMGGLGVLGAARRRKA